MANIDYLSSVYTPTSERPTGPVSEYHVPNQEVQHEYTSTELAKVSKDMGRSVLSSISSESLFDDRNL